MTKEDAIDIIKSECYVFNPLNFDRSTMVNTALDMAVKALKQEDVLDEIRAEIEKIAKPNEKGGRGNGKSIRYGLCWALDIINKYKTENEG